MYAAVPSTTPTRVACAVKCRGVQQIRVRVGALGTQRLGEAEVQHFDRAVGAELDVRGLQVAMDDPGLVRRLEGVHELPGDGERFVEREGTAGDHHRQILAVDEFHHQRAGLDPVDRGDVRMVQRRQCFGFAREAHQAIGIVGEGVGEDLERDRAIELRIPGPIDFAHSASSECGDDFVRADPRACGQHLSGVRVIICARAG
jgi:hypothetical protein